MLTRSRLAINLLTSFGLAAAIVITPSQAQACITGEEFVYDVHDTYPLDGDSSVPTDSPLAILGTSNLGGELMVEVMDSEGLIPGTLVDNGLRHFWRPDVPFAPATEYTVHLWTEAENASMQVDELLVFTTADDDAAPLAAPAITVSVDKWEKKYTKCISPPEPGSCDECGQEEVIMVEERMRVRAVFPHHGGPFGRFYSAKIRHGVDEAAVSEPAAHESEWWGADVSPLSVSDDLGLVGSWEGEEVCVRAWIWDPRDLTSEHVIECVPIGDVNTPSPEPTTDSDSDTDGTETESMGTDGSDGTDSTGSDSTDMSSSDSTDMSSSDSAGSDSTDSDSNSGASGGADDDALGCSCASTGDPSGALLLFGLGALLRRRPR